jgi:uncharacterized protein YebE (UPF0316 family)
LLIGFTASFPWLPLVIFVAETCVVTCSTVRIIFISRGMKVYASALGFLEILIWLFAIGQIMQNLNDIGCYLAFAAGFTIGNYCGVLIEKKLAIGTRSIQVITNKDPLGLTERLQAAGYGVTNVRAEGATGPVTMVFTVVKRRDVPHVVDLIKAFDTNVFYAVDDVQDVEAGVFPSRRTARWVLPDLPRLFRSAALEAAVQSLPPGGKMSKRSAAEPVEALASKVRRG